MELRAYLRIIVCRRWIALIAFLATTGGTLYAVLPQPPVYEAVGTFVVTPRAAKGQDELKAFETLIRGDAINATFAEIARSEVIRARAESDVDAEVAADLSVGAEVLIGTQVLSISVTGGDPEAVRDMTAAIGRETREYVRALGGAYRLDYLDYPKLSAEPVGPSKALAIALGGFFGILLGTILAVSIDHVFREPEASSGASPVAGGIESRGPETGATSTSAGPRDSPRGDGGMWPVRSNRGAGNDRPVARLVRLPSDNVNEATSELMPRDTQTRRTSPAERETMASSALDDASTRLARVVRDNDLPERSRTQPRVVD